MTIVSECPVCTDQLTNEDIISVMPCGHVFHASCVTRWLKECKNKPVCPLCRAKASRASIIGTLYFAIPNISISASPSKDVSKLTNRVSTLEANLLRAERDGKENSEKLELSRERVKKFETEKVKSKKRDEVGQIRLAALKAKVDHFKGERDEFEARYNTSAVRLKKLETIETDKNLLDRVEKLRNLNDMDDNQKWLTEFHSRQNVEEMVKYQRLLQKEFTKNQQIIDRQARQISKLEKDFQREHRLVQNHEKDTDSLKAQLEQSKLDLYTVRQKVNLIKESDPNSTTYERLCVESPLSDDMLARVRKLKRKSDGNPGVGFTTPMLTKRTRKSVSEFSPDLFATSGNGSGFSDNTFFEQAFIDSNQVATPTAPAPKSRVRNLCEEAAEVASSGSVDKEPEMSPVFGGSRLHRRVRVKTAPFRALTNKQNATSSPNLDITQLVTESNLFKKDRHNRDYNGFGVTANIDTLPAPKSRVQNLREEATEAASFKTVDEEPETSPVFGGKRLLQRVKVKPAPFRAPTKNAKVKSSPNLDITQLVTESNLFKKDRHNRNYNGFGVTAKRQNAKLKSTSQPKQDIRDFFKNTKL